MKIFYTSKFEKAFKKLPKEIQLLAVKKEIIFKNDIWDLQLRTHKLSWKLFWYYSFSIDYNYRILFEIQSNWDILFINIWDHDIYKN